MSDKPISFTFYKTLFCPIKFYLLYYCNRNIKTEAMYRGIQLHSEVEYLIKKSLLSKIKKMFLNVPDCNACSFRNDSLIPNIVHLENIPRPSIDIRKSIFFSIRACSSQKCILLEVDNNKEKVIDDAE